MIKPAYDNITITPINVADMAEPKKDEQRSLGIAEEERKTLNLRFRVVGIGPGRYNPHLGTFIPPMVKPGDIIILADSDQSIRDCWKCHAPVMDGDTPVMFTDEEAI